VKTAGRRLSPSRRPDSDGCRANRPISTLLKQQMLRFDLDDVFSADCVSADTVRAGQIYHKRHYTGGGCTLTGIARYFAWRPEFVEGYHSHWRVDCFVKRHALAGEPMQIGEALVAALIREGLCTEPIWLSAHRSDDEKGKAYGEVWDLS
jgi:hypothetical protein